MKKPWPKLSSDEDAAEFLEKNDMTDFLEAGDLKPARFRFASQDRLISFRLSSALLTTLKIAAKRHKTKYQKLIRHILEENVGKYLK